MREALHSNFRHWALAWCQESAARLEPATSPRGEVRVKLLCSVPCLICLRSSTLNMSTVVQGSNTLHALSNVGLDGNAEQKEASSLVESVQWFW